MRVLMIDGGSYYAETLARELAKRSDVEIIRRIRGGETFDVDGLPEPPPEVVVVDSREFRPAEVPGGDTVSQITELFPEAHIFVIADPLDVADSGRGAPAPVMGVVLEGAKPSDVATSMRNAVNGTVLVSRPDILALIRGAHVGVIARALGISIHTVRTHVKNILIKLNTHSQLEAVAKALAEGWISADG